MHNEPRLPQMPIGTVSPTNTLPPLHEAEEFLIAQPVEADEAISLRPPDCPSREQHERCYEPVVVPKLSPPAVKPRFQYSVSDFMIVTAGIALGLAGSTWMPAEVFAAVLGLVTLIGLLFVSLNPLESRTARMFWGTWIVAYFIAVCRALVG